MVGRRSPAVSITEVMEATRKGRFHFGDAAVLKLIQQPYLPIPEACHSCGHPLPELVENDEVYGRLCGEWPILWLCRSCGATSGVHRGTNVPLGTLADWDTKAARKEAHEKFDVLWRRHPSDYIPGVPRMGRGQAYSWLASRMGLAIEDCHIGLFDVKQCWRVVRIVKNHLERSAKREAARKAKKKDRYTAS